MRAELTAYADDVEISATGQAEQVISTPEDVAQWRWAIRAREAGELQFQVAVTALSGETETPLFPTRYFDVLVDVRDTFENRAGAIWGGISRFLVGAGSGMAALGATIVAYLVYRQGGPARRRRRPRHRRPPEPPAGAVVRVDGPTVVGTVRGPRRAAPRPGE
ncbi:hypothetical protein AB0J86_15185 [Micromonospora sp. NPDC049559]|uniref:hypothetical protein n=1 Tax=Micromonospora sp. NPDC049559 TaxID=3155923 RepID=UPI00344ADAF5